MSFNISIQHDLKKFRQQLSALEKQAYQPAVVRTLNRTAESAKVASARYVAAQLGSKQAGVKRRIETIRATPRRLWATLVAHGRPLQLIEFVVGSKKPTQQLGGKRGLVKTKVFGRQKTYYKAFIAPRRSGDSSTTMYIRKGKERKPLKLMYGPGIESIFKTEENTRIMEDKVRECFGIEFASNLAYYIERLKNR
jgi:hypothetical protein